MFSYFTSGYGLPGLYFNFFNSLLGLTAIYSLILSQSNKLKVVAKTAGLYYGFWGTCYIMSIIVALEAGILCILGSKRLYDNYIKYKKKKKKEKELASQKAFYIINKLKQNLKKLPLHFKNIIFIISVDIFLKTLEETGKVIIIFHENSNCYFQYKSFTEDELLKKKGGSNDLQYNDIYKINEKNNQLTLFLKFDHEKKLFFGENNFKIKNIENLRNYIQKKSTNKNLITIIREDLKQKESYTIISVSFIIFIISVFFLIFFIEINRNSSKSK
jgi:hypothetical protein